MVHPEAIYLHEAVTYRVDELNLTDNYAHLTRVSEDYYTEPREALSIEILSRVEEVTHAGFQLGRGELEVTNQVTGYRKIKNHSREILGVGSVDLPAYTFDTTGFWMVIDPTSVEKLRLAGKWLNDPNDYGADWDAIRLAVRQRDNNTCQNCGKTFGMEPLHVHHIVPFRLFSSAAEANQAGNLVTLCPDCHRRAEERAYVRSGLTGLAYAMRHLLPFHLMCDSRDLDVHADPICTLFDLQPAIIGFDSTPGGIGLAYAAYQKIPALLPELLKFIQQCPCADGCPSCIGPAGEEGYGGKAETLAILELITHG
jgi:DEAD/DEAH box helicase domain-containing protein